MFSATNQEKMMNNFEPERKEPQFLKFERDQEHRVRLIPPTDRSGLPYIEAYKHWVKEKARVIQCQGEICQFCHSSNRQESKTIQSFLYPILDRTDQQVKVMRLSRSTHLELLGLIMNPPLPIIRKRKFFAQVLYKTRYYLAKLFGKTLKEDERVTDITHPLKGSDITIMKTGEGIQTKYYLQHAENKPTPMLDSEEDIEAVLNEAAKIREVLK